MRTRRPSRRPPTDAVADHQPSAQPEPRAVADVSRRPPAERAAWIGRLAGNAAATAVLARGPAATADPPAEAAPLSPAEGIADATNRLVTTIGAAAGPFVGSKASYSGRPVAEWIPGMVRARMTQGANKPAPKAGNPMTPLWDALFSEEVKEALTSLDTHSGGKRKKKKEKASEKKARAKKQKAARIKATLAILGGLLPSAGEGAAIEAPATPLDAAAELETEKQLVTGQLKSLITTTKGKGKNKKVVDKWEDVRIPVLVQFGALSVGPREALARATAYYDTLVRGSLFGTPLHGGSVVHPNLQQAFDAATRYVEERKPPVDQPTKDALKATAATGYSTNIRENRNAPDQLSDHSFGWAVDFDSTHNPNIGKGGAQAPVEAVTGKDPKDVIQTDSSLPAAEVEKAAEALRAISSDYTKAMESKDTLAPALLRIANAARAEAKLSALAASAGTVLADAATAADPARETALRAAIHPEGAAPPKPITDAEQTLKLVGNTFNQSFATGKGQTGRVKASSEATAGSVAVHGFMSLPALFAAALSGNDAGGLRWLQHDRMHFELRAEPSLYGSPAPPKDDAHG